MENIFIKASRLKVRFETIKGSIMVEQLWDIPLTSKTTELSLDNVAKNLNRQLKELDEESFVIQQSTKNEELEIKFEIVKYIIKVRLNEIEISKTEKEKSKQRQKIFALIKDKENDELRNKSKEELLAMLN